MCTITAVTNLLHAIGQRDTVRQSVETDIRKGGGTRGVLAKGHSAWMLKQGICCFSRMVILTSHSGEAASLLTLTSDPIERIEADRKGVPCGY